VRDEVHGTVPRDAMTAEELARTLAAVDKLEPFEMSDEEQADIEAWRQKVKAYTLAEMHQGIEETEVRRRCTEPFPDPQK
jgi:hypothetical protein